MNWIKRNWKPLALLGAGAALMAVLVFSLLARREDRGFMIRECVSGQSSKGYTKWGYSNLPVPIVLDQPSADEWGGVTTMAVHKWNDVAGKVLLADPRLQPIDATLRTSCKEPGKPNDPIIFITRINSDGSQDDGSGHAHLYFNSACRIHCVDIALPGLAPKTSWEKIVTHELGHSIGLDHDDFEDSVMYYGGKAMGWGMDTITEADAILLRGAYR